LVGVAGAATVKQKNAKIFWAVKKIFGDASFGLSGLSGAEYRLREKRGKMLMWGSG
jgi:hypothetical protein